MQQRLARGEEAALGELYDRYASLVHSLAHRVMDDEDAAALITREVFGYVWENPDAYDPKQSSLRSWIAGLTQQQAVHRLRQTAAAGGLRTDGEGAAGRDGYGDGGHDGSAHGDGGTPGSVADVEARVREASTAARADYIVTSMPAPLRDALDLAYRRRLDYRQAAVDLGVTEDEARRRMRLGLQLLSTAMDHSAQFGGDHHNRGHLL
jgi:RNA polymerase sigma-70 factor (ECF subfamily)